NHSLKIDCEVCMQHNQEKWEGIYPRSELTRLAGVTEEQSYNPAGHSEAEIVLVDDIAMQSTLPIKIIGNQPIPQTPALLFTGLLHIPPNKAIAMVVFAHPWTALLLCISGITCLS